MSTITNFDGLVQEVFIETGTGAGNTLTNAVEAGFERLFSIDLDGPTVTYNTKKFRAHPNVHILRGRSVDVLPRIIDPARSTLFWLDAHYSGGSFSYDSRYVALPQCELLGELAIIRSFEWAHPPVVLIDDAFMFGEDYWKAQDPRFGAEWRRTFRKGEWPRLWEIERAMEGWAMTEVTHDVLRFDAPRI